MIKAIVTLLVFLFSYKSFSITLLQETKEIVCKNKITKVVIEKKDRYFDINGERYNLVEFLDKAILAKSAKNDDHAIIQMTQKNTALLIEGVLYKFKEQDCEQVKAHKVCTQDKTIFMWSPTLLKINNKGFPVKHYGVYPNDGTFFIGIGKSFGVALVDFGSKFSLIYGKQNSLNCEYM